MSSTFAVILLKIKDCLLIAVQQTHPRHYDDSKNVDGDIKHINTKGKQLISKDYIFFLFCFLLFLWLLFFLLCFCCCWGIFIYLFFFLGGGGVLLLFFRGGINGFRFLKALFFYKKNIDRIMFYSAALFAFMVHVYSVCTDLQIRLHA